MRKLTLFLAIFISINAFAYWEWLPEYIHFYQMHDFRTGDTLYYTTDAVVTFGYTPDVFPYYLNMVCPCVGYTNHWVVRNIYLPDASWISTFQYISWQFDLVELGAMDGIPFEAIGYRCYFSDTALLEAPVPPDYVWEMIDTFTNDAEGFLVSEDTIPGLEIDSAHHPSVPGDSIVEMEYRGCRMRNIDLDDNAHPDTPTYAGDKNACAPAAAANSLKWLSDVSEEVDIPGNLRDVMEELSTRMGREANNGVTTPQIVRGKLDYIHAHGLNIRVKFQSFFQPRATGDIVAPVGMSRARNEGSLTNPYPTWEWLKSEVADSEDIEILYHFKKRNGKIGGHAVVLSGLEETASGKKIIKVKHDRCQGREDSTKTIQENLNIYVDSYGRMRIRGRRAAITGVISESPGDPYLCVDERGAVPEKLDLSVRPNPFNSAVNIYVDTKSESAKYLSSVEIYDLNGRLVSTLRPSNIHEEASCEGAIQLRDKDGLYIWRPDPSLGSGIYFVRIEQEMRAYTKPVIYIK